MNTVAISDFRSNLPALINHVSNRLERLVITISGKPKAVVISPEELESIEETAEILAIPNAYEKIMKGASEAKKGKGILLSQLK